MKRNLLIAILMTIFVWSAGSVTVWAGSMPIGVLPEDTSGITVIRKGEVPINPRLLYEGDRLQGSGLNNLDIRWHPGAHGVVTGEGEMVVAIETTAGKSWWAQVQDFLGFGEAEAKVTMNVTRGQTDLANLAPLPGFSVTLLAGEPTLFSWGNATGQTLVFQDEEQNVVFRKPVSGVAAIRLSPEEIGMRPGQRYTWRVEGLPGSCQVVLLEAEMARQVAADLQRIEGGPGSAGEKLIKKAGYLQLITDLYPFKADLYWLSYRLLQDDKKLEPKLLETSHMLQRRMVNHLTAPLYNFIPKK